MQTQLAFSDDEESHLASASFTHVGTAGSKVQRFDVPMPTDGRPVLVPIGTPSAVVTTPRVGAETMTVT